MDHKIKRVRRAGAGLLWMLVAALSLWAAAVHVAWSQTAASAPVAAAAASQPVSAMVKTETAAAAPDFSVAAPGPWLMHFGQPARALRLTIGAADLSGLRIAQAQLLDASKQRSIGESQLRLCGNGEGADCAPHPKLMAKSSQTVYLHYTGDDTPLGRYTGTLDLAVDGRAEVKTVTVEVAATSRHVRALGAALIALGVALAWWLTVASRQRLQRLTLLLPVAAAAEQLTALRARLVTAEQATGVGQAQLLAHIDRMLQTELTERWLIGQGYLATTLSTLAPAAGAGAQLQTWLQNLGLRIAGLAVLVQQGVEPLAADWQALPHQRTFIEAALRHLDSVASAATEAAAQQRVSEAQAMAQPPVKAMDGAAVAAAAAPAAAPLTLQRLVTQIEALSFTVWWAYLALTTVAGIAILIINNAGFGTPMDLVFCLFWGFGLPVTLDKLVQLSPATVATPLGITLPKAA
jgi:hypothetical protein